MSGFPHLESAAVFPKINSADSMMTAGRKATEINQILLSGNDPPPAHEGLGDLQANGLNVAFKYDGGKPRMDLIDPEFLTEMAQVLTMGSDKYDESKRVCDNNWRQGGMRWGQVYASLQRHLVAFWSGEDTDLDTQLTHLAHAACNIMFLHNYSRRARHLDDRDHGWRRPRKIYLDIDGVLADWCSAMRAETPDEKVISGGAMTMDCFSPDHWFWVPKDWRSVAPENYAGFLSTLNPLADPRSLGFEPAGYVTHRKPEHFEVTQEWLRDHGFPYGDLIVVEEREDKVAALKDLGCDLFVEDNFDTFVELNNAGILCLLLDTRYNRKYDVGGYRIGSLSEVSQWA